MCPSVFSNVGIITLDPHDPHESLQSINRAGQHVLALETIVVVRVTAVVRRAGIETLAGIEVLGGRVVSRRVLLGVTLGNRKVVVAEEVVHTAFAILPREFINISSLLARELIQ